MGFLKYKGYTGSVEYSEEDNSLFGKVQCMTKGSIIYEESSLKFFHHFFPCTISICTSFSRLSLSVMPKRCFKRHYS